MNMLHTLLKYQENIPELASVKEYLSVLILRDSISKMFHSSMKLLHSMKYCYRCLIQLFSQAKTDHYFLEETFEFV